MGRIVAQQIKALGTMRLVQLKVSLIFLENKKVDMKYSTISERCVRYIFTLFYKEFFKGLYSLIRWSLALLVSKIFYIFIVTQKNMMQTIRLFFPKNSVFIF